MLPEAIEKNSGISRALTGTTTLLAAFIVTVLMVFAMLSVSQASADARRAEIACQSSAGWYAADVKAQAILAELRTGSIPNDCTKTDSSTWSFSVPIDNTKEIAASVRINSDKTYEILSWQMRRTVPWEPERNPFDDVAKP